MHWIMMAIVFDKMVNTSHFRQFLGNVLGGHVQCCHNSFFELEDSSDFDVVIDNFDICWEVSDLGSRSHIDHHR